MIVIICFVLMIAAPVLHLVLCGLRLAGRIRLPLWVITLICLPAGVLLPALASYLDILNLPAGIKCATASVSWVFLGLFLTITIIPVSAVVFSLIAYYKQRKLTVKM